MAYVYCIDLGEGNGCVGIPILKKKFLGPWDLWGPFGPWDLWGIEEKSPIPQWVIDDQLDQVAMQDLAVLVTIDELADSLSAGARRGVKQHIKQTLEQVELPEGRRVQRR
jgi:hypothetical protein